MRLHEAAEWCIEHREYGIRCGGKDTWPRKTCHGEHSSHIHLGDTGWIDIRHLLTECKLDVSDLISTRWEVKGASKSERYNKLLKLIETWINEDEES